MDEEEFFKVLENEQREIIDFISGVIFEEFPNVKERISFKELKYVDSKLGTFCKIYVKVGIVIFEIKGKKYKFDSVDSVDRDKIRTYLKD